MDDALAAITKLLHDDHGIPVARLSPTARISHDLGVDGDDASDLFQRLHERFGTDFSALNEQWTEFFHNEGGSLRGLLLSLATMIPSTALAVWTAIFLDLSTHMGGLLGVLAFFGFRLCSGWLFQPSRSAILRSKGCPR